MMLILYINLKLTTKKHCSFLQVSTRQTLSVNWIWRKWSRRWTPKELRLDSISRPKKRRKKNRRNWWSSWRMSSKMTAMRSHKARVMTPQNRNRTLKAKALIPVNLRIMKRAPPRTRIGLGQSSIDIAQDPSLIISTNQLSWWTSALEALAFFSRAKNK